MGKLYDIVAVTGTYIKDGVTKNRYQNIGSIVETHGKQMLKLEAVPINWDGWAYLNEPRISDSVPGKPPARTVPVKTVNKAPRPDAGWPEEYTPWERKA